MNTEQTAEPTQKPVISHEECAKLDAELVVIDERMKALDARRQEIRDIYITHQLTTAHYYVLSIKGKATIIKHRERLNTILAMLGMDANKAVKKGILTVGQTDFVEGLKTLHPIEAKESKKAYDLRIGKMAADAVAAYVVNGLGNYQLRSKD